MNNQIIEGNWMQLKGKVREQWGKLTDDDMNVIAGKRDLLIGKLKERYGKTREAVSDEVAAFERKFEKKLNERQLAGVGADRQM